MSKTFIDKACAVVPEFENRIYRFDKKLRMALPPITITLTEGVQPIVIFISPCRRDEAYLVATVFARDVA